VERGEGTRLELVCTDGMRGDEEVPPVIDSSKVRFMSRTRKSIDGPTCQ
jgi:hypothetical protein